MCAIRTTAFKKARIQPKARSSLENVPHHRYELTDYYCARTPQFRRAEFIHRFQFNIVNAVSKAHECVFESLFGRVVDRRNFDQHFPVFVGFLNREALSVIRNRVRSTRKSMWETPTSAFFTFKTYFVTGERADLTDHSNTGLRCSSNIVDSNAGVAGVPVWRKFKRIELKGSFSGFSTLVTLNWIYTIASIDTLRVSKASILEFHYRKSIK